MSLDPGPNNRTVEAAPYQIFDFHPQRWMDHAACAGVSSEIFFPERGQSAVPAKTICARCPVRKPCLAYAVSIDERHGVWGGTSEGERWVLRLAAAAPVDRHQGERRGSRMTLDQRSPEPRDKPVADRGGPRHPEGELVYLNRRQAALYANCGLSLLHEATASGTLRSIKLGSKRLYRRSDIDAWLEQYVV
jgi:excisionase family DNA binding protein